VSKKPLNLRQAQTAALTVDREHRQIRGLSVITAGEALGHGFTIDAQPLRQVAALINATGAEGVKSRVTHPEVEGRDGVLDIVGSFREAEVVGQQVKATFTVGRYAADGPRGNVGNFLLGLAEEQPTSAGLSISISDYELEGPADGAAAVALPSLRVLELHAVDFVDTPAANPRGMLAAKGLAAKKTKGLPMYSLKQLQFLTTLGLPADAFGDTVTAFVAGLTDEQRQDLEELAVPAPGSAAATAAALAERQRCAEIRRIALKHGFDDAWSLRHIESGASLERVRGAALSALAERTRPLDVSIRGGEDLNLSSLGPALSDAIIQRAGRVKLEKPHDRAKVFAGMPIPEMLRAYCRYAGMNPEGLTPGGITRMLFNKAERQRAIQLGGYNSSSDFDYILADVMNKTAAGEYAAAPRTWDQWAQRVETDDFKQNKIVALGGFGTLPEVKEGAQYTRVTLADKQEVWTLATYGVIFQLTWQAMVNDDLSVFAKILPDLIDAARAIEDAVCYDGLGYSTTTGQVMTEDSAYMFASAHYNTGTTAVLSVASNGQGESLMAAQLRPGTTSRYLNLQAAHLLVPPSLKVTAQQLATSVVDPALYNNTPNPFSRVLNVVSEARLAAKDSNAWYLACDYRRCPTAIVGFLRDEPTPKIFEKEGWDVDAREFKVRHSVAGRYADWRGLVFNAGGS